MKTSVELFIEILCNAYNYAVLFCNVFVPCIRLRWQDSLDFTYFQDMKYFFFPSEVNVLYTQGFILNVIFQIVPLVPNFTLKMKMVTKQTGTT